MANGNFPYKGLTASQSSTVLFHAYIKLKEHVVKKNSKTIGHRRNQRGRLVPFIRSTERQKSAEGSLVLELRSRANDLVSDGLNRFPISHPVWVVLHFFISHEHYYTKKNERTLKLPDLSNLYELPQDAMQKAGILKNDSLIYSHDLSRILPHHETALEIWVLPHEPASDLLLMAHRLEGQGQTGIKNQI